MTFEHRAEHVSDVAVAAQLDITVVEPLAFLVIELGAALAAMGEVEESDHLIEGHQLDVVAGVPPEQCKEVDHGLRQVATLAVARRLFATLRVVPLEGEDGEPEAVTIALAQLASALRLEQQRQMRKLRHRVYPT